MSHHSSSVNGEGTNHKDPLSRILDELSSFKLWKQKLEIKEKGKEGVEISQDEREQIREEERRKILKLKNKTEKGTGDLARHGPLSWPSQKNTLPLSDT